MFARADSVLVGERGGHRAARTRQRTGPDDDDDDEPHARGSPPRPTSLTAIRARLVRHREACRRPPWPEGPGPSCAFTRRGQVGPPRRRLPPDGGRPCSPAPTGCRRPTSHEWDRFLGAARAAPGTTPRPRSTAASSPTSSASPTFGDAPTSCPLGRAEQSARRASGWPRSNTARRDSSSPTDLPDDDGCHAPDHHGVAASNGWSDPRLGGSPPARRRRRRRVPARHHAPSQLAGVIEGGSVLEWRHHLSMIVASPWSPYSRHLVDLARQSAGRRRRA